MLKTGTVFPSCLATIVPSKCSCAAGGLAACFDRQSKKSFGENCTGESRLQTATQNRPDCPKEIGSAAVGRTGPKRRGFARRNDAGCNGESYSETFPSKRVLSI